MKHSASPLPFAVGDWVTQYSAGYWKVVAIYDKYADQDDWHTPPTYRKGDHISYWVVLKKGFTPKMKWSNACECVDGYWCAPVSPEEKAAIEQAFESEPAKAKRFEAATSEPRPGIQNCWITLPKERIPQLEEELATLPPRFTGKQLQEVLDRVPELAVDIPPSTVLLNLLLHPYELDESLEFIYCGYSLEPLD